MSTALTASVALYPEPYCTILGRFKKAVPSIGQVRTKLKDLLQRLCQNIRIYIILVFNSFDENC